MKITATLLMVLWTLPQALAADAEAGQTKAAVCAACHGQDGKSINPMWPNLAGQHAQYIERQLKLFKSGARPGPSMAPMVAALSEQDMVDLAAWYSSQSPVGGAANPDLVELGRGIYQGGVPEREIPACASCHGPTGAGNPLAGYPVLAGQHATYTRTQLTAFKDGQTVGDKDDVNGQVMAAVAEYLKDDEIEALASFIQGLRAK